MTTVGAARWDAPPGIYESSIPWSAMSFCVSSVNTHAGDHEPFAITSQNALRWEEWDFRARRVSDGTYISGLVCGGNAFPRFHALRTLPPQRVHEVWQMDFKVAIPYGDQWLHLHTVRDPVSSVYIGAFLFVVPCASSQVSFEQVRLTLRQCFQQWGTLPERIQTDGEASLVNLHHVQSPFPTPFILWLTGLGIAHVVIHRVTQNAEVERCHRSLWDYVLSGSRLPPMPERQTLLDQALYELNHELSSRAHGCNGYPPLTAHPEALCPPRPYRRDHELQLFDVRKVEAYLSNRTWQRQITANGTVQLGGQANRYSVGRAYARQTVTVHFDATDRHFVFSSTAEPPVILRRLPAKHLTAADLTGLTDGSASLGPQQLALPYLLEG
jgi:hypothetical protein